MPEAVPEILVVDDHDDVREALRLLFKGEGIATTGAASPKPALESARGKDFAMALIDLNYHRDTTSGTEGLELLRELRELDATLPVVVMTAWGGVEIAVEAIRRGACDFVEKPWNNERLLSIVRNQLELARTRRTARRLDAARHAQRSEGAPALIAESAGMKSVLDVIAQVARSDAAILVTGENGTGKGLVARAIHAASNRADEMLVTVNMGGMSEGVFESELFGHVKGAFTDARQDRMGRIEMAEGGTLFLDEIANTPPSQQAKLLRVIETGEYERLGSSRTRRADVRFVSATNADPTAEVSNGRFRQDLLFRLNTVEIHLPPLRKRLDDIGPLASHFLRQHAGKYRKEIDDFEPGAMDVLLRHAWPGNIRELNHAVERAVLLCSSTTIQPGDLGLSGPGEAERPLEEMSLEEVEKHLIRRTLARCGGNAREAAAALGLSRSAFYRRLDRHGL